MSALRVEAMVMNLMKSPLIATVVMRMEIDENEPRVLKNSEEWKLAQAFHNSAGESLSCVSRDNWIRN